MAIGRISIVKVRDILLVSIPNTFSDETVSALQEEVLEAMERSMVKGLVLDISTVDTLDSFFARIVAETAQMVSLMGGRIVITGMRASVAITTAQMGLSLKGVLTALDVDRALLLLDNGRYGESGEGE